MGSKMGWDKEINIDHNQCGLSKLQWAIILGVKGVDEKEKEKENVNAQDCPLGLGGGEN